MRDDRFAFLFIRDPQGYDKVTKGSVDMSVPFKNEKLAEHSDFNSIRDSFYLLNAMNQ